jgi:hypothetical protein
MVSAVDHKLTAPKIALERLTKGEPVPKEFLELAAAEPAEAVSLLQELKTENHPHK